MLLRGINVGGSNKVRMAELRQALTSAGCGNVASYIQSGNLVLESALGRSEVGTLVAGVIEAEFGFRPACLVLEPDALVRAIAKCPYPESIDPKTVHVWFAGEEPDPLAADALEELAAESESWTLAGRVLYLHAPDGIARSKFAARAERGLGVPATARNMRTLGQLRAMTDRS